METLIVVAVLAVVTGAVLPVFYQSQQSYASQHGLLETTQQTRIALDQVVRYLRQAGNDPFEILAAPPVEILGNGYIRIHSDITGSVASLTGNPAESTGDPDGLLASIYEQVTVRHDAGTRRLFIDIGYGEQLLADGISSFDLPFFDGAGNPTADAFAVARVKVEMVGETARADMRTGKVNSVTVAADIFLRSGSYQVFG